MNDRGIPWFEADGLPAGTTLGCTVCQVFHSPRAATITVEPDGKPGHFALIFDAPDRVLPEVGTRGFITLHHVRHKGRTWPTWQFQKVQP